MTLRPLWQRLSTRLGLYLATHGAAFAAGVLATLLLTGVVADLFRRAPAPEERPHRAELSRRIARGDWGELDLSRVKVPDPSPKLAARLSEEYGVPVVPAGDPRVGTIDPETGTPTLGLLGEFVGGAYPWGFDEIVTYQPGEPVGVVRKARPEPRVLLSPRARVGVWAERCVTGPACPTALDVGAYLRWDAVRLRGGGTLEGQVDLGTLAGEPAVRTRAAFGFEWDRLLTRKRKTPKE